MTPITTIGLATGLTLARQVTIRDTPPTVANAARVVVAGAIATTILLALPDWAGNPLGALILTTAVLVHGVAVAEAVARALPATAPATTPPTD